jgi:L-seryl-tRNA(Ser) seleniumtransferase
MKRLRANPLLRSLRVDKFTIAALEATLGIYRDPARALREIPILAMLARPVSELRVRANKLRKGLSQADVRESLASVGGGAFPNTSIPSVALAFSRDPEALERRLRHGDPPVIGRVTEGQLLIDLRSVQPEVDETLAAALRAALA